MASNGDGGSDLVPRYELAVDPIPDDVSNDASLQMNLHPTETTRLAVMERDVAGEERVTWASAGQQESLRAERVHNGSTIHVLAVNLGDGTVRELERFRVESAGDAPKLTEVETDGRIR